MGLHDPETITFRIATIVALIVICGFLLRLLGAIRTKAQFEQRIETHIQQTEPLVSQFHTMQNAITSGEIRHQEMTLRLDRYIENQDNMNRTLQDTLNILLRKIV